MTDGHRLTGCGWCHRKPTRPARTIGKYDVKVKQLLQRIRRHWRIALGGLLLAGLASVNMVAWRHAWAMSHFVRSGERTVSPEKLGVLAKVRVLALGVTLPRPENRRTPKDAGLDFQAVRFPGAKGIELEAWLIPAGAATTHGVVLLFHGYGASKEALLPVADEFHRLGWDVLLVDFHGSGGSGGDTTSIGWHEAEDVAAAFQEAARRAPGQPRVLYGVSMGAVACLRAVHVQGVKPDALIVECPFDRMLTTVRARFHAMRVPAWPMAELLAFWGGQAGGFDAFAHNPVDYAASVRCPTLFLHGGKDPRVSVAEVTRIHDAVVGAKTMKLFSELGHQAYVEAEPEAWRKTVAGFLRDHAR